MGCHSCGQASRRVRPARAAQRGPLYRCAGGCDGVFAGDRYMMLDGLIWCERCLSRVAGRKALQLLGEFSRRAF